jgi:hypothetical protein
VQGKALELRGRVIAEKVIGSSPDAAKIHIVEPRLELIDPPLEPGIPDPPDRPFR